MTTYFFRDHAEPGFPDSFSGSADILVGPLEDRLDTSVRQVPHPPIHPVLLGHPLTRTTEEHPLHAPRDQHPIANHRQTLRPRRQVHPERVMAARLRRSTVRL
jgi:hypothetical protein